MAEDTQFTRLPEYAERYANNIRLESSAWDLKLIMGVLDQATDPATVRIHSAVNIPWVQAKILAYFIHVNVLFQEIGPNQFSFPRHLIPAPFTPPAGYENDPRMQQLADRVNELREDMFLRDDTFGMGPVGEPPNEG